MACCGKTDKDKSNFVTGRASVRYAPKQGEETTFVEVQYIDKEKQEYVGKPTKLGSIALSNIFRKIYEVKEKDYRIFDVKRKQFPAFPKNSKFGLCENLCVTDKDPKLTVGKDGKLIPYVAPEPVKPPKTPKDTKEVSEK